MLCFKLGVYVVNHKHSPVVEEACKKCACGMCVVCVCVCVCGGGGGGGGGEDNRVKSKIFL